MCTDISSGTVATAYMVHNWAQLKEYRLPRQLVGNTKPENRPVAVWTALWCMLITFYGQTVFMLYKVDL